MIEVLLIGLFAAAVTQPPGPRRIACLVYAGMMIAFDALCSDLPGTSYYLAAAATDSVCCLLLSRLPGLWIVRVLEQLCLLSIAFNYAGWLAYETYAPAAPYNSAFTALYFCAILCMTLGGAYNESFGNGGRFAGVWLSSD